MELKSALIFHCLIHQIWLQTKNFIALRDLKLHKQQCCRPSSSVTSSKALFQHLSSVLMVFRVASDQFSYHLLYT